jgi:hypothetical protein
MSFPSFATGEVLTAADMNAVGLWKVAEFSTTSGVAVTSPTVFSSVYDNYRIVISNMESSSPGGGYYLALGSATLGSAHFQGGFYVTPPSSTLNGYSRNSTDRLIIGTSNAGGKFGTSFDICGPNLPSITHFPQLTGYAENGALGVSSGLQNSTTQFTTFTVSAAGATFSSGTVSVYGYKKG